ncbi:penicillin acylase family protein [Vitiosangium sp. GDMCC 1.1324]|uniref:penicillin acylase family protein n=1 Tax=Vitiosangium sp. (strain GDMCC 1.1324) TaxID=2138576 RepID=UPI000D396B91|nr:penicillin acylase family protein [Vitiosangium sp. GDMCC 1.1324]PTL74978.1 penicillin acylase family protein [Vitiosangium sp. GDMCC 1.1324]
MKKLRQVLQMLRMLPPVVAAATPGVGPRLARGRWPRTQGTLKAPGLNGPVEIIRDTWGVPHIFAKDEHDLFFAQGYVQGQDRLWQMEMGRRIADGTLAGMMGAAALPVDRIMRTLGLRRAAERSWAGVKGEARTIAEAFAEGVNARMKAEPLPLECSIFGVTPAPWTPVDTLARGNILSLALGGNYRLELFRAQLLAEVGEELTAMILPSHAPETPLIVPPEAMNLRGLAGVAKMEGLDKVDAQMGDPNIVSGSNNWVVHGDRTASGKPLLANDVHIGLGLPSTWYESGLHGGRFNVVGFTLPGVPMVVLGHNGHVAWGMSNLGPDTQDFYIEKLDDPKAPKRYEFKGEWHDLEVIREEIPVKGGALVPLEIRRTRHGPIMNPVLGPSVKPDSEPLALRWALEDSAPLLQALVQMNLAGTWKAFRAALELWECPGQNFVYADAEGNIGYQSTGKIPTRAAGHQGLVPVPGWTGEYEWQGWIPFAALPASHNPPAGFAATANNKITSDDYPYLIAHNWFPGYRAKRITDLLAASTKHTVEDMRRIQAETYSLPAEALRPYLLAAAKPADSLQTKALDEVKAWDLRFETDRIGATVFQTWYITVLRNLLSNKLGKTLVERYLASDYERHGSMHMPWVIGLMEKPDSEWFNDAKTPGKETRDDLLRRSFAEAVQWLSQRYGPDAAGWQWGRVHTMTFINAPLGRIGPAFVRRAFNSRTMPARGDNYSVDGASFLWSRPYDVVHGTALRMIVDLSDFSKSVGIHTPGQSEHLYHPHRTDLMEMSHKVEFHPLLFTRQQVEAHTEGTLTLQPATEIAKRG